MPGTQITTESKISLRVRCGFDWISFLLRFFWTLRLPREGKGPDTEGGIRGRHKRTPVRLGSGLAGRARPGAASCGRLPWLCFASCCEDGDGWLGCTVRLCRAGMGAGCWVGLGLRPGFGPQSVLLFKIPFLFPTLFIICKLIRVQFKFEFRRLLLAK
jgi:hypothetical protein